MVPWHVLLGMDSEGHASRLSGSADLGNPQKPAESLSKPLPGTAASS